MAKQEDKFKIDMKKHLYTALFLLISFANAQNFNPKTIALPDNPTMQDFSFLKDELKGVQVVMLGEKTHFDGNVFELKTEVIKYLYEEMGFKTIAFESGVYELYKANKLIKSGYNVRTALRKSLHGIWGEVNEISSLSSFIAEKKDSIKLFGFDSKYSGVFLKESVVDDLYRYCENNNFTIGINKEKLKLVIESITEAHYFDEEEVSYIQLEKKLLSLKQKISNKNLTEEHFYWKLIIDNLLGVAKKCLSEIEVKTKAEQQKEMDSLLMYYSKIFKVPSKDFYEIGFRNFIVSENDNFRDKIMADNLIKYIKSNPNEKIICWGANQHFVKNMSSITFPVIKNFKPMGSYVYDFLKDKLYSLAIVTAEANYNKNGFKFKTPIKKHSFEDFLIQTNKPYLFVSASQSEMHKLISNRFFSSKTFVKGRLSDLHNGYIFSKKAITSTLCLDVYSKIKQEFNSVILKGEVVDDDTKEPIAYAEFYTKENKLLGVSSKDGKFKIQVNKTNKVVTVVSNWSEGKTFNIANFPDKIKLKPTINKLDAVVITAKMTNPTIILKNVIQKLKINYQKAPYRAKRFVQAKFIIDKEVCLDVDLVVNTYNKGYGSRKQYFGGVLKEKRWNKATIDKPKNAAYFFNIVEDGVYNSRLLTKAKLKKFTLVFNGISYIDDVRVYDISFSANKDYYNFTNRMYFSKYTGSIYVNTKDFAIVKMVENWKRINIEGSNYFTPNTTDLFYRNLHHQFVRNETFISNYKKINTKYRLKRLEMYRAGVLVDKNNIKQTFEDKRYSIWYNFNIIKNKINKDLGDWRTNLNFSKVENNKEFWENFKFFYK